MESAGKANLVPSPYAEGARPGIGRVLREASKVWNRLLQERLAVHNIGLAEYLHLRALWAQDGVPQIELAQRIGIEKASSTAVLNSLETKDLIRRTRDAEDRRKVNVFLTEKGQELKETLLPTAHTVALQAIRGFHEDEVLLLVSLLRKMIDNLQDETLDASDF
ncbi:MarR family winged helix-turn-helix transcriptional regulator [Pseudochelatococcus sp. B33]